MVVYLKFFGKTMFFILVCLILSILQANIYGKTLSENSYLVIDYDSGTTLIEKNKSAKVYPASTTKILTCILALENLNLEDEILVTKEMLSEVPRGSSTMKLAVGDTMTTEDLLYGLMLPSGNDAAIVVAHLVSSNTEDFVALMNKKAKELGCTNTHFVTPHGFHNDDHYTTAEDMAKIFMYALKNEKFLEIISTGKYSIGANKVVPYTRNYTSTNMLINNRKYDIYGKTGYTEEAGNVFISYTDHDGHKLISILLDGNKNYYKNSLRFDDTLSIYDYIFSNYSDMPIISKGSIKLEILDKKSKSDYLYSNNEDIKLFVNSNSAKISYVPNLNNNGKINLNILGNDYYLEGKEVSLSSQNATKLAEAKVDPNTLRVIFLSIIDIIVILILIIMIYVIISLLKPKKKKIIHKNYYNQNLYR